MWRYNCIIIEDEPLAIEIIEGYIKQISFLKLKAICYDAISAIDILQKENIDLIFLDIHLPKLKGLDLLHTLTHPPKVIITTAYHQYALKGYEYNVIDYLLKPIEFSRFLKAVNKLRLNPVNSMVPLVESDKELPYMFFNVNKKKVKIYLDDILYIEGQKEYVKIIATNKSIVTKLALNHINDLLSKEGDFIRIHRSFIISRKKIDAITSNDIEIKGKLIPIGRSYKEMVQYNLNELF